VDNQRAANLARVAEKGWVVVMDGDQDTFTDDDISASTFGKKARPAYTRLMDAVARGEVDVVVTWAPDRLHRRPIELENWLPIQEGTGTTVHTLQAGDWDLSTPGGRAAARNMATWGAYESELKSQRGRLRTAGDAQKGRMHGPHRTFGLERITHPDGSHTWRLVEEEAAVVRECAKRVLSGESLFGVARDLNARGITTLAGKRWTHQGMRRLLISGRICGWREHTPGRTKGDRDPWGGGELVAQGDWPAMVTREQVEKLRRIICDPSKLGRRAARARLLSGGLVCCGLCGANLRGKTAHGKPVYACPADGCPGVTVGTSDLDAEVVQTVRDALGDGSALGERLRAHGADSGADSAWQLVSDLRSDLAQLSADKGSGLVSREEWLAQKAPLDARLVNAEAALARAQEQESAALLVGGLSEWDASWAAADGDTSQRRALISAALVSVTVARAVPGRNRFDAGRISYLWRA
jgi:DNA invertase Pin-like site-specific DNA recombinase